MKFQVVVQYDPGTESYTVTVPGLPIVVDADSEREALQLVKESLQWYLEDTKGGRAMPHPERPVRAKVVTVEVHG